MSRGKSTDARGLLLDRDIGHHGRADMTTFRKWAIVAAVALLPATLVAQQQSAVVRGIVTGVDRQVIPDVTVVLLDQLGSRVALTKTEPDGRFRFQDVPPGTYTVIADAASNRSSGHVVAVQGALPVDVELTLVGRIAQNVVVEGSAEPPPVAARTTIAGDALRQLPTRLASRGVQHMLATLPGWTSEDNGLLHVRGVDDGFLYVQDGIPIHDRMDTLFGIAPDPAGVGSMNVLTGYIPPEYGLKSGAVVEVQSSVPARAAWAANVDTGFGTDAQRSVRIHAAGPAGNRASVGLSAASERSNRFLDPVHPDNLHNEGGVVTGEGHVSVAASERDIVKVNLAGGRSRYQVPHGEVQEAVGQDSRQRLVQRSQSASWQRFWSDAMVSQLAIYRRQVAADLRSSPADTPVSARSSRNHNRLGSLASLTMEQRGHTLKVGVEAARVALREDFTFAVTDPGEAEAAEISDRAAGFTPERPFSLADRADRMQWAFYVQDSVRPTANVTIDFGLRFDRTRLLVPALQWSPRAGVAYRWPNTGTTLRASLNRFFQPPQPEYLLLSSSAAARALSPLVDEDYGEEAGGAELDPERQTAWEVGVDHRVGRAMRVDAAYWSRHVRNYADPNVFLGTTIIFPNSVSRGTARGVDVRFELPRSHGWSSYASYTISRVQQVGPINGGLFLEENMLEIGPGTRFTPDHDQRHVSAAGVNYDEPVRGFSASLAARYESGTPLEVDQTEHEELAGRPGAELVDFETGRVTPRLIFDVSLIHRLLREGRVDVDLRIVLLNLTGERWAYNFGNPFSGTHFGPGRTVQVGVRAAIR